MRVVSASLAAVLVAAGIPHPLFAEIDWEEEREFWAFRAPVLPDLPEVDNEDWVRNDIDRFILRRIEAAGLTPAPEASRESFLRRLSLDLTGLPPSQKGLDLEPRPGGADPYDEIVSDLLASPRYGERLASLWMTVVGYSEDQPAGRQTRFSRAYLYRDWIIEAFNRDLPYDEFVRKQLAADLLGDEDHLALGFLALGPYPRAGNTVVERADAWAERVDLVSRGLLGLSVACARCHDHLEDPITAEDYYAFAGIFASTDLDNVYLGGKEAHVVSDAVLRNLRVFIDGDPNKPGPLVPRRNLRLLSPRPDLEAYQIGSGRGELARELSRPDNPLLARVIVNRIWGEIIGQPLVATPSNFGRSGARPTHPELLDYLAVRFMENGWSLKWLIREVVSSSTYRQETVLESSSDLPLFAGMRRRRLTAEMIRDSMLVAAGTLSHTGEGSDDLDDPDNLRRTIYGEISRGSLNGFLREFDYPAPDGHVPLRETTITPAQKLFLLNNDFVQARTGDVARRLQGLEAGPGLELLYQRLLSRPPSKAEREAAIDFLGGDILPKLQRWRALAQVLFSSNSFLYRD